MPKHWRQALWNPSPSSNSFTLCTALSGLPTRGSCQFILVLVTALPASPDLSYLSHILPPQNRDLATGQPLAPLLLSMAGHLGGCEFEVSSEMGLCNGQAQGLSVVQICFTLSLESVIPRKATCSGPMAGQYLAIAL